MASLNKVMLIGNLGRDPEVRYMSSGDPVATLALATTSVWNDKNGQRQESTEWHRVIFFGKQAEICQQYLKKGSSIYVEGKIQTRKWTDNQGIEKFTTEIVLQNFNSTLQILDSRDRNSSSDSYSSGGSSAKSRNNDIAVEEHDDEIPF